MAGAFLGIAFGDKIHWVHFGEVRFGLRIRRGRSSGMCFEVRFGRVRSGEVHFGLKVRWVRFSGLLFEAKIRGERFERVCFGIRFGRIHFLRSYLRSISRSHRLR